MTDGSASSSIADGSLSLSEEGVRKRGVRQRREAILAAALEEFVARGFAAARIEDVATRAGVAKGTVYLHFADKHALFEAMVRAVMTPPPDVALMADAARREAFEAQVLPAMITPRPSMKADVIRLVISEGMRQPRIAECYYREVLAPTLAAERESLRAMGDAGTLAHPGLADFPQLLVAPAILAIIWEGLFGAFEPLDTAGMLRVHAALMGQQPASPPD